MSSAKVAAILPSGRLVKYGAGDVPVGEAPGPLFNQHMDSI